MKTLAAGLEILNGEQYSSLKRFWRIVQVQIGKDSVHYCRPKMAQVVLQNEVWQEASAVTGAGLRFPLLELSLSGRRSLMIFESVDEPFITIGLDAVGPHSCRGLFLER